MTGAPELRRRPSLELPAGAIDAHCHIFGPANRFPYAEGRTYTPVDHGRQELALVHELLGVTRAAIVQASCHGRDHRALLDALEARPHAHRGVALADETFADRELQALHDAGVRGVRFSLLRQSGRKPDLDGMMRTAGRIAALDMGWHVELHIDGPDIAELTPTIRRLPMAFAIDHMGRVNSEQGVGQPAFKALMELARDERCWVKICDSPRIAPPPFPAGIPIARVIVEAMPDRVVWGSDLPHPDASHGGEEALLVELIAHYAPTEEMRHRLLVDNPARLYFS